MSLTYSDEDLDQWGAVHLMAVVTCGIPSTMWRKMHQNDVNAVVTLQTLPTMVTVKLVTNAAVNLSMRELLSMMGRTGSVIASTFEHMEIMEQEQTKAMEQYPEMAETLFHMFGQFSDMSGLIIENCMSNKLFRHHVAEILQRIGSKQPPAIIRMGTTVEIALGAYFTSLKVPLDNNGMALYEYVWIEIFGEKAFHDLTKREDLANVRIQEDWVGATEENLNDFHRKCSKDRGVPDAGMLYKWRKEAIESGTHLRWMDYQDVEPVQIDLFAEVTA
jgi:hypothetical protein